MDTQLSPANEKYICVILVLCWLRGYAIVNSSPLPYVSREKSGYTATQFFAWPRSHLNYLRVLSIKTGASLRSCVATLFRISLGVERYSVDKPARRKFKIDYDVYGKGKDKHS